MHCTHRPVSALLRRRDHFLPISRDLVLRSRTFASRESRGGRCSCAHCQSRGLISRASLTTSAHSMEKIRMVAGGAHGNGTVGVIVLAHWQTQRDTTLLEYHKAA